MKHGASRSERVGSGSVREFESRREMGKKPNKQLAGTGVKERSAIPSLSNAQTL
jgi:hypothetical protein